MTPATATDRLRDAASAIEAHEATIGAFISLDLEEAAVAATASDRRHAAGRALSAIDGAIVAVKDAIDTAAFPTTFGSKAFSWREPMVDAPVVDRLIAAGAIVIGKTKLEELSCGSTGTATAYGDTANPWNPERITGGSSSGSAAAVATGFADIAIGTDTSCSVRLPAAHCGIVGLKPSFDRVPRDRVQFCSPHLDHIGPMARTVADVAHTLAVTQDPHHDRPGRLIGEPTDGVRLAVLVGDWIDDADSAVQNAFTNAVDALRGQGFEITELDLDLDVAQIEADVAALCAPMAEEYGEHLAAADHVSASLSHWIDVYRRLTDDQVERGHHAQRVARATVEQAMVDNRIDGLLCPTARVTATPRASALTDSRTRRILNCTLFNVTGQPSLSVPCGFDDDGLPIGLLISGHRDDDARVLQVGAAYQQVTDWHDQRPSMVNVG